MVWELKAVKLNAVRKNADARADLRQDDTNQTTEMNEDRHPLSDRVPSSTVGCPGPASRKLPRISPSRTAERPSCHPAGELTRGSHDLPRTTFLMLLQRTLNHSAAQRLGTGNGGYQHRPGSQARDRWCTAPRFSRRPQQISLMSRAVPDKSSCMRVDAYDHCD